MADLAKTLLSWYDRQGRSGLPWRSHAGRAETAYHTWISEIMLQQTTVAAVIPYYQKFMTRWPTVESLADAPLDDVLAAWAGLGYYARARNLHKCAQTVVRDHGGVFPSDVETLKSLPGIGDYTAAAVAAIAYDKRAVVVDGNIERVLSRVYCIDAAVNQPAGKKIIREHADTIWPNKRSGDFAQAMMDLGATVCTPQSPRCMDCPWKSSCEAFKTGRMAEFPVKIKSAVNKTRHAVTFVVQDGKGRILLQQRPLTGLLGGLWETPSTPWTEKQLRGLEAAMPYAPDGVDWTRQKGKVRHVFSHFPLEIVVYTGTLKGKAKLSGGQFPNERMEWFSLDDLPALSNLMQKVLRHASLDY